jgi:hypothetical protein
MKTTIILIVLFFSISLFAQDKISTKGLPNGYAWLLPPSLHPPIYDKEASLLASLQQRNVLSEIDSSINNRSFPLGCDGDIDKLLHKNTSIEIKDIVKRIDKFYKNEENLIIPVLGAYCYSVKKLVGVSADELEEYRQELLKFSEKQSKQ